MSKNLLNSYKDCTRCKFYLEQTCTPNGFGCNYEPSLLFANSINIYDKDIRKINDNFAKMKKENEELQKK